MLKNAMRALACCALVCSGLSTYAAVITSGNIEVLASPPASLVEGQLQDDSSTRLFFERQRAVDAPLTSDLFDLGTVATGTQALSYFFHFDPVTDTGALQSSMGTVQFDAPILAVFSTENGLILSGNQFRAIGTSYGFSILEPPGLAVSDSVTLLTASSLQFHFNATAGMDEIRVLVGIAQVPEPGVLALILLALAAIALTGRRAVRA